MISNEYIAGLFDGEGFFTFRRVKGGPRMTIREWRFQAYGSIVMREEWLLKEVANSLKYGKVSLQKRATDKHSEYYIFNLTGNSLYSFCKDIGPLLKLKYKQGLIIKEICEIKFQIGNKPVSNDLYCKQEMLWEKLRLLNVKGPDKYKAKAWENEKTN